MCNFQSHLSFVKSFIQNSLSLLQRRVILRISSQDSVLRFISELDLKSMKLVYNVHTKESKKRKSKLNALKQTVQYAT